LGIRLAAFPDMAHYNYERLTALDNSFLVMESADTPTHVASVALFDSGPLRRRDGGIDFDRIASHLASRLHKIPRYREKLAYVPIEGHPVWVDDTRFNLNYHLRHTALPPPGDMRQLKRLCARIMSQQLDRGKPLWETWIVEGAPGGDVAMISKVHHCMVDGVSGADLLAALLSERPDVAIAEPVRWIPRPAPAPMDLLRDELVERIRAPFAFGTRFLRQPRAVMSEIRTGVEALADALGSGFHAASETPFNQPIGPHRRFDWTSTDIATIRAIRQRLGGSLNDVVLATVAGAVRRFFERRGVNPAEIDFRVFVPVSMRTQEHRGTLGNHVAAWIVDLPIAEHDPVRRLRSIAETTAQMKQSKVARGTEILTELTEWTGATVIGLAMRLAERALPFNLVVTNVPGPPQPLYLLGARMKEVYPMVPLTLNQGLGIALFSHAGRLFWGFNADWEVVPDLHDFVIAIDAAFAELAAAGCPAEPVATTRRAPRKRPDPQRRAARRRSATAV
jgi:WS/DGAT/MGAT family acyltransferase